MITRFLSLLSALFLFVSCGKETPKGLGVNAGSFSAIFLTEKDASNYTYLTNTGAITLYRQTVPKSYPLADLKNEKDCYFYAAKKGSIGNVWVVSSVKDKNTFWQTYFNRSDSKWAIGFDDIPGTYPEPDLTDLSYQFVFHSLGKENGMDVVAIESKEAPGYYISNTGLPISAVNAVSLTQHDKPEQAVRFYLGKP